MSSFAHARPVEPRRQFASSMDTKGGHTRGITPPVFGALVAGALALAGTSHAASTFGVDGRGALEQRVALRAAPLLETVMVTSPTGSGSGQQLDEGGLAGLCPPVVSSHTSSNFGPDTYTAQAGFEEGEIAAASYTLPANAFPLKLELAEFLVARPPGGTGSTVTEWSFMVWEGKPSAGNPPIVVYSSQDGLLPPITTSAPSQGVKIDVFVDPSDPDQIIIFPNADNAFTIGLRIDKHNTPSSWPCVFAPPAGTNVFPVTDQDGVASQTGNWIFAIDCGGLGCPAGWSTYQQFPSFCTPSGDWVMRATWSSLECEPVVQGACCVGTSCSILSADACALAGGNFLGDNTACLGGICQVQTVPCCFESTGGCVNLSLNDCVAAGGVPGPVGTQCAFFTCFPEGACCLPDGTCAGGLSPEDCTALNGSYQGDGSTCDAPCPDPVGACCFGSGFCLALTEADCIAAAGAWAGANTSCVDGNGNGVADDCEPPSGEPADLNGDGVVDGADLGILLSNWGKCLGCPADLNGDGVVDGADLGILLSAWTQ